MTDLEAEVKKLMDSEGVDVAFDAVGAEDSIPARVATTKANVGYVLVCGYRDAVAGIDIPETGSDTVLCVHQKRSRSTFGQ